MDCYLLYSFKTANVSTEKLRLHKSFKHKETTISDKRMPQKHDENVGCFENSSAIWVSTGQEIDFGLTSIPGFRAS